MKSRRESEVEKFCFCEFPEQRWRLSCWGNQMLYEWMMEFDAKADLARLWPEHRWRKGKQVKKYSFIGNIRKYLIRNLQWIYSGKQAQSKNQISWSWWYLIENTHNMFFFFFWNAHNMFFLILNSIQLKFIWLGILLQRPFFSN